MPSLADEIKQALRALAPAREVAQQILRMEAAAQGLIATAEKVVVLEARRTALEKEIAAFEVRVEAQRQALGQERTEQLQAIAATVRSAEEDARNFRDRLEKETRAYIAARERDREDVQTALAGTQRELARTREALQVATEESQRQATEDEQARRLRRAEAEAEIAALGKQIADLRRDYAEVQKRVTELAGRR